ncbi:hypothetical protein N0V88_001576 [Collariella sp. IMI 366227]|nr:hypothetical protein N0V88_001576 [Collariella sp. IMI 366227]
MSAFDTLKAAFEASLHPSPTVISVGLAVVLLIPILLHFLYTAATPTPPSLPETSKSKIKALLFMVDAASLSDTDNGSLSAAAEYLYDVLIALQKRFHRRSGSRAPASLPVLVAANKMDLFTALPTPLVKSQLEAELGRIRKARAKGLLDSGVDGDVVGGAGGGGG